MDVGIAFDLKSDFALPTSRPDDALEEYDSPRTIDAIAAALERRGHRVRRLGGGRRFVQAVLSEPPDLVFNLAEGFGSRSREAHVPAVCELLGIACTHSDPLTLAVSLDKSAAKRLVAHGGIATARATVVHSLADVARVDLRFPLFAKPLWEGSSMGVRRSGRVDDRATLERECARLLDDYRQPALVEEFLPGAEFTVGLLGAGASARAIGVMEIAPKDGRTEEFVYSVEVKRVWDERVAYHVPPNRPRELVAAIESLALAAYHALECRDIGRVDVRLDADGRPNFVELNPLPGLNPGWSDLCVLAERCGIDHDALVGAILDAALDRLGANSIRVS